MRGLMPEGGRVRLVLPRVPHAELLAGEAVDELGGGLGFSRDTLDEVKLAVLEACLNALEYGLGEIEVELVAHRGGKPKLEVWVTDHGPGFDPGRVPHPVLNEKIRSDRKRGWGLELMRRLMDEVVVDSTPGRTRVRMTRFRGRD
jgi:serine/threonine-protein kinase RsbW